MSIDARLQRRVQRYGWDLACAQYEELWQAQLACAQAKAIECASLAPGERVLDVACATGLVAFAAARAVGPGGRVVGVDLSGAMIDSARRRAHETHIAATTFERMDAEKLDLLDASFDVALCSLGLMYMPDPSQALREMRRVLRPRGRVVAAVWGERSRCGWSPAFPIVDDEVESDVCPLFFGLGRAGALAQLCADAGFEAIEQYRFAATLSYADGEEACRAAFVGGPLALAWSRFDERVRERVRTRYLDAIAQWRDGGGYRVPGEFVVVSARRGA